MRLCFDVLKSNSSNMGRYEIVNWGKYKDAHLTYFEICVSDNEVLSNYITYMIDNGEKYMKKEDYTKLIKYYKAIACKEHFVNEDFEDKIEEKLQQCWSQFELLFHSTCVHCNSVLRPGTNVYFNKTRDSWKFKCFDLCV